MVLVAAHSPPPSVYKVLIFEPHSRVSSSPGTAVAEALWAPSSLCFFLWKQTGEPICLEPHCTVLGQGESGHICAQFLFTTLRLLHFYPLFPHIPPLLGQLKHWQTLLPWEVDIFVVMCIFHQRISDLAPEIKVLQNAISFGSLEMIYWNVQSLSPLSLVNELFCK